MTMKRLGIEAALLVVVLAGALPFSARAGYDAAFVHAVEPKVGRTLAETLERRIAEDLDAPQAPRLMPVGRVREILTQDLDPARAVAEAEETIESIRARLSSERASREMLDLLDSAREDLLLAMVSRPRVDLVRDSWALRGLAVHFLGDAEAARRDYARVLESDPSFRPDPRLFPPGAREQMGHALMARTDSHWRVLSSGDIAQLGRLLEVDYVVLGHLQDTGLLELSWRVDVFDVVAGRFVGQTEVHFPDATRERNRAASQVAELVAEVVPRVPRAPREDPVAETRPEPRAEPAPERPPSVEVDTRRLEEFRDGPFDPALEEAPPEPDGRSARGWIIAATVLAVAAGGTAAYIGMTADPGTADVRINLHR